MDKESLHNYGTTIIVTIILVILLVLAPTFGKFIEARFYKTANSTKSYSGNLIEEAVTAFDYITEETTQSNEGDIEAETEPEPDVDEDSSEVN